MHLVVCYGRFNPPTIAHKALFDQVGDMMNFETEGLIATSQSFDSKNPLGILEKNEILSIMAPRGVKVSFEHESPFALMDALAPKYETITLLCGSDRKRDYVRLQGYHPNLKLHIVERSNEISSSLLREACLNGDYDTFVKYYGGPSISTVSVYNTVKERVKCLS